MHLPTHLLLEASIDRLGARGVDEGKLAVERQRGGRGAGRGLQLQGDLDALAGGNGRTQAPRQQARGVVEGRGAGQLGRGGVGYDVHAGGDGHGEGAVEEGRGQAVLGRGGPRGRHLQAGRAHGLLDAGELGVVAVVEKKGRGDWGLMWGACRRRSSCSKQIDGQSSFTYVNVL